MSNNMKKILIAALMLATMAACGDDDDKKDLVYPEIAVNQLDAIPNDCHEYRRGEVINVNYVFTDDTELGKFNIEIHNNFDHHSHSTSATECMMDPAKSPVNPWVFNHDYDIPSGQREYRAAVEIAIPSHIDTGDYHFMVRLTDKAGWQQIKAVSIKVVE